MERKLVVVTGKDQGRLFPLPASGSYAIGRSNTTETKLTDVRVSRVHCHVEIDDGGRVVLVDNNSAVGTFVNDQKITKHDLAPNDVIKIGDTELRYETDEDVAEMATLAGVNVPLPDAATLAGQAGSAAAGVAVAARAGSLGELLGTTLAHFSIDKIIAPGQTSVMFRARDTNDDRPLALKVLKPEAPRSDAEMQRLARVLQVVYPLRHANIIPLHEIGKDKGKCWFAMDLIDGESLASVIARVGLAGMLDWQHALRLAIHVGKGLDYLHQQKVIHRHITPRSILINNSDKQAKLGGLLSARPMTLGNEKPPSRPDQMLRDVAYMPPERARDDAHGDQRSDIYSYGATIYALLTGRAPFDGLTPVETIAKVLQAEPPRIREFQYSLPEAFEQVVFRALAKKPEDRYQKVADMLADLDGIAKGQSPARPAQVPTNQSPASEGAFPIQCVCGQRLQARKKFAGTKVRCPSCGKLLLVPSEGGMPAQVAVETPPPKATQPIQRNRETSWKDAPGDGAGGSKSEKPLSKPMMIAVAVGIVLAGALVFGLGSLFSSDKNPSTASRPTAPGTASSAPAEKPK